jgi:hypothetical protein
LEKGETVSEIDHEHTNIIVCPWCGYQFEDSWEMGEEGEIDCYECRNSFSYLQHVEVTWTTKRERCRDNGCQMELMKMHQNPSIHNGFNVTVWECKICHDEIWKFSKYVGDTPWVELLTLEDFK